MKTSALILFFLFLGTAIYSEDIIDTSREMENANPEYIEKCYQHALEQFDKQEYEKSLQYIRHVIKSDMNNYKLRYLAAHDYWQLGNFDSATAHFQIAILSQPQNPEGYMDYALMKLHERDYWSAERTLQTALFYMQKYKVEVPSKFYNIYSRLELLKGFPDQSLKYAQLAKAAFAQSQTGIKDKLEAMTLEARSQLLLENFDKAELAMQWALSMRNNNVYAYNLLGYIYARWRNSIMETDPQKADNLKKLALENYKKALKTPDLVDEFKKIIETNIASLN
ncbi:MAG: tetratricopeptide repeat protein [Spirochaetia bacterium]|nr:tetratricopeptide repeat protein [Spirochaetia bacterium]